MIRKLLFRPRPHATEGLNAYLLRLAEANGLSVGDLWPCKKQDVEVLLQRLGISDSVDVAFLKRLLPQFEIEKVLRPVWNRHFSRFCPLCLAETPIWRQEWELTLVTACVVHERQLLDSCGSCGRKQNWKRRRLNYCDCGVNLAHSLQPIATVHEVKLASIFCKKMVGNDKRKSRLQPLSLHELNKLVFTIGAYAHTKGRRRTQKISNVGDCSVAHPIVIAGAEVLMQWPAGFFLLLDAISLDECNKVSQGRMSKRFGYFYQYLYKELCEPCYAFLHQGFEIYIEKNWKGSLAGRNKRLSENLRRRHSWVPINLVAKELKTSRRELEGLIDEGRIDANRVVTKAGRNVISVSRNSIASIQKILEDIVDLKTAAQMFGLKKNRMAQLLDSQTVGSIFQPNKSGTARWGIPRQNLLAILSLADDLPIKNESDVTCYVSLRYALRYWIKEPALLPALLLAIIEAEIVPVAVCCEGPSLVDWVFESSDLRNWAASRRRGNLNGALTIPDAARHLKIKEQAAYNFVALGIIKTTFALHVNHQLVEIGELTAFSERYVLGREIGVELGCDAKQVAYNLKKYGILPCSGPDIDGGVMNLYLRTQEITQTVFAIKCLPLN